jgi:hypothetical protein
MQPLALERKTAKQRVAWNLKGGTMKKFTRAKAEPFQRAQAVSLFTPPSARRAKYRPSRANPLPSKSRASFGLITLHGLQASKGRT